MATMRERSPGVWELRVYVGRDPITGRSRQLSRTFRGGKRLANAALAQMVVDVGQGKHKGSTGTVGQLLDEWLATGTPEITAVTRATYARTVKLLKPVLGSVKLSKLGPHEIDLAYQSLTASGTSAYVMRQVHVSLRSALSTGMRWGWIGSNPAKLCKPPRIHRTEPQAPSSDDVTALIRALEPDDPDLAAIVTVAALTGLRRGELCGLRWSDVDVETLHIRRAWVVVDGKAVLSRPKMGKEGSVTIVGPVAVALSLVKTAQAERAQASDSTLPADGWVLSMDGMGNEPRKPDHVGRCIGRVGKAAGVKITPHSLRHFATSTLIAEGVDIRTASTQMRHSPRVLLEHYAAQDPARLKEAAEILGRSLTPTKGTP